MYVSVQSIQDSIQDSKEVKQNKVIHLNNMHGTKHTTEFVWLFIFMNRDTF